MLKRVTAIIPARGGSKGLPRKNLAKIGGVTLLERAINAAHGARYMVDVVVSTDDLEIANLATLSGAHVVNRNYEQSAADTASSESVLLHALQEISQYMDIKPDVIAFIQCTSPLLESKDIDLAIEALYDNAADVIFSAVPTKQFLWRDSGVSWLGFEGVNHDRSVRHLRADVEQQYIETGAFYIMRAEGFKRAKHRFFDKVLPYVVAPLSNLEIDTPEDFEVARMLLERQHARRMTWSV